jgi:hypothetical protein
MLVVSTFLSIVLWTACSYQARDGESDRPASTPDASPVTETTVKSAGESRSVVDAGEVKVKALSLFKAGSTKVYLTDVGSIPQAPPIPNSYEPLNAAYELETDAVFSDAVMSIMVPTAQSVDFGSVRILRLNANDMYPSGFVWSDCTVLRDRKNYPGLGEEFFPDPEKRYVSCYFDRTGGFQERGYFTVVTAKVPRRTTPATRIEMILERAEMLEAEGRMRYVLIVKNAGPQDVAEVNFDSTFAMGVALQDVHPLTGRCQPAKYGDSESSVMCYLGEMKKGDLTRVEFTAKPGREKTAMDKKFNRRWVIRGFSRKNADDEVLPGEAFKFEPLAK